jgi:hypothetical protein
MNKVTAYSDTLISTNTDKIIEIWKQYLPKTQEYGRSDNHKNKMPETEMKVEYRFLENKWQATG